MHTETVKYMTTRRFAELGRTEIAYVKVIVSGPDTTYAIHAADGAFLWECEDREEAFAALRAHDMVPVSVH